MSEPVVSMKGVFCVHRTAQGDSAALQGLDLDIAPSQVVCVLGPSGAGKSTLLRVIAGMQPPSAGSVRLLGRDIGRLGGRERAALRHRHLGFLGQSSEDALAPGLSAQEAVMLPLALRGIGRRPCRSRADELLEAASLRSRAAALPEELSGGERQRVALCAALAHGPTLLLADEPTGDLDRESAMAIYELITAMLRPAGAGAIIASHDPLASSAADRTIGLRDGRVVEEHVDRGATLVIGRGGWVRLPGPLQKAAALGQRVTARAVEDGLLLAPASSPESGGSQEHAPRADVDAPSVAEPARVDVVRLTEPARVELRSVRQGYRQGSMERQVFRGLTRCFEPGRFTVITGRSGSGKTTLLRLIAGLDRPKAGEISIDGSPLSAQDREQRAALRRRRIGFMAQDPVPVGFLSALENIVLALRIRGWSEAAAAQRAGEMLDLVEMSEQGGQRVWRLSAGEVQRVALARALAGARGLLLVDEPTSRLDEANAQTVGAALAHAASAEGQTVICASHDPAVIARAEELLALEGDS